MARPFFRRRKSCPFAAKDAPGAKTQTDFSGYGRMLADSDSRWFMFFYFITFGGFVGLASALPLYFTTQFHASGVAAGLMVSLIVALGSCFRPVGGYIADRIGGVKSLSILFAVVSACYFAIAFVPEGPAPAPGVAGWNLTQLPGISAVAVALFSVGTLALGMGNGAVFQLLPQRFRNEVGVMTGLVGAAGGLGGFVLAKALAYSKGMTGGFGAGFIFFGCLAALGLVGLTLVKTRWRTTCSRTATAPARPRALRQRTACPASACSTTTPTLPPPAPNTATAARCWAWRWMAWAWAMTAAPGAVNCWWWTVRACAASATCALASFTASCALSSRSSNVNNGCPSFTGSETCTCSFVTNPASATPMETFSLNASMMPDAATLTS